jgi:hypothetical protein
MPPLPRHEEKIQKKKFRLTQFACRSMPGDMDLQVYTLVDGDF